MADVHIVWNPNKGDILSRFAHSLANSTGWTLGKSPDKNAALNYFMLYIQVGQNPNGIKGLNKTAALFSHYEIEVPKKVEWWKTAAPLVDIRTTWAQQYLEMLLPYGESYTVIPPIDPQFMTQRKPVIGISGYVHPGGRKGEGLVARLFKDYGKRWEIRASGKGWGVSDIREREWGEMPDFYNSLDVYLVTSLTEGIPMPPLEALARGKKVVIPEGVGLMSELPDSNPVYRYAAGHYESMVRALEDALAPIETATRIAAIFNEDAWAASHKKAFGLDSGAPIVLNFPRIRPPARQEDRVLVESPFKTSLPNSGAVIVAYGAPARECAMTAIQSWKAAMPSYPIALISDFPLGYEDIFIEHPDSDIGARSVKTALYSLAPAEWDNVLYLDADTETIADVSVIFQWLQDGWEFIICTNPAQYNNLESGKRPDNGEETDFTIELIGTGEVPQPNGGVFAFRRSAAAHQLMSFWAAEWNRYGGRDQMALLRALYATPIRWLLVGNEWNTITRYLDPSSSAGILHHPMNARRWEGIIHGRLDSKEAWERVIK